MMVTGASAGPKEKSASLTGGKSDAELGVEVGSALMTEQLISGVGVSRMTGCSMMTVGVGGVSVLDAQAVRMKRLVMEMDKIKKIRFIMSLFCVEIASSGSTPSSQ